MIKTNNFHLFHTKYFLNLHFQNTNLYCDRFTFCDNIICKNRTYLIGEVR